MDQASGDSGDEQRVVDLHLNDVIELLLPCGQHVIELLRLGNRSRESVENESMGRIEERLAQYANGHSKLHSDEGSTVKRRELQRLSDSTGTRWFGIIRLCHANSFAQRA